MVVVEGVTEILLPVPTSVPPHEPVYQFQAVALLSEPPVTRSVAEALPQYVVSGDKVGKVGCKQLVVVNEFTVQPVAGPEPLRGTIL